MAEKGRSWLSLLPKGGAAVVGLSPGNASAFNLNVGFSRPPLRG